MTRNQEQYGADNAAEAAFNNSRNNVGLQSGQVVEGRGVWSETNNTWIAFGSNVSSSTASKVGVAVPVQKLTVAQQAVANKKAATRSTALAGVNG